MDEPKKKEYEKPELIVYGDVREITRSKDGDKPDGDGGSFDDD